MEDNNELISREINRATREMTNAKGIILSNIDAVLDDMKGLKSGMYTLNGDAQHTEEIRQKYMSNINDNLSKINDAYQNVIVKQKEIKKLTVKQKESEELKEAMSQF